MADPLDRFDGLYFDKDFDRLSHLSATGPFDELRNHFDKLSHRHPKTLNSNLGTRTSTGSATDNPKPETRNTGFDKLRFDKLSDRKQEALDPFLGSLSG